MFPPAAGFCRLESPWLPSAVQRETPGSFIGYGWCIISSPFAKLLIEGVMSWAAPPRLAGTDARATRQLKAACVAQIAVFVTSGSVVFMRSAGCVCGQRPLWLRVSTRRCYSRPWPRSSDIQETASGVASVLLSAESKRLVTQEGDIKSPPNHLLSPAVCSNASLARKQVPWFEHGSTVRRAWDQGTGPLLSNGVYCWRVFGLEKSKLSNNRNSFSGHLFLNIESQICTQIQCDIT